MKKKTLALSAVAVLFAGGAALGIGYAQASPQDYVGEDGIVDMDLLPETMELLDRNGKTVLDSDGNPVLLDSLKVLGLSEEDAQVRPEDADNGNAIIKDTPDGQIVQQPFEELPLDEVIKKYGWEG